MVGIGVRHRLLYMTSGYSVFGVRHRVRLEENKKKVPAFIARNPFAFLTLICGLLFFRPLDLRLRLSLHVRGGIRPVFGL